MRRDLGGFGTELASLRALDGVEIGKPFVLLYGPNGSGKTSLLRMLRAVNGLAGERTGGHPFRAQELRLNGIASAGGDLGMLAAFEEFRGKRTLRKGLPGVLDAKELEWTGQRMYHLAGRSLTAAASATRFDDADFENHVSAILRSKASSHGQFLLPEWEKALSWAAGKTHIPDPFDEERPKDAEIGVNDLWKGSFLAHHDIYEACAGRPAGGAGRHEERWLLLDEPELAMDVANLAAVLSALLWEAAAGHLRVFCASHSPLFAAGIARHTKVQVLDLSGGWLDVAAAVMASVADPVGMEKRGAAVMRGITSPANQGNEAKPKRTPNARTGGPVRK